MGNNFDRTENNLADARVAKVLSNFDIVINKGRQDGVLMESRFFIHRYEEEILDPITKEPLERLEHITGYARPKHIQERISTLTSDNQSYGIITAIGTITSGKRIYEPLDDPKVGDEVQVLPAKPSSSILVKTIEEEGDNANGEWVRYSNGEQECIKKFPDGLKKPEGYNPSYSFTYPASFAEVPPVVHFIGIDQPKIIYKDEISLTIEMIDDITNGFEIHIKGKWK